MERPEEQNKGIVLKEYGRNTQKIVNYILTIEDRDRRSKFARTLIELMKQINPNMKDAQDSHQKLWDHLYIMSNFSLDVDTEYPMPEKSVLDKKPMKVEYSTNSLKFKHYGKNIELLIKRAIEKENPEEREFCIIYIGKLMKRFYASWNKENVDDEVILEHLELLSHKKLTIDITRVKSQGLFDTNYKEFVVKESNKFNTLAFNGTQNSNSTSISNSGNYNGNSSSANHSSNNNYNNNNYNNNNKKNKNFKKKKD